MKQICIVPYWDLQRQNRIFDAHETFAQYEAFRLWRIKAAKEGFDLNTSDICPPENADGIWLIDLPRKRRTFDQLMRIKKRSAKVILQVSESPLVIPHSQAPSNQAKCDIVFTYSLQRSRSSGRNRYYYGLPNYFKSTEDEIPFSERRCAIMVNSNKEEGWLGTGRVGLRKFPGFGKYINGWDISAAKLLNPAKGELYSWRREFARAAEKMTDRVLDIYGAGWDGEPITWLPIARPKPYRCAGEGRLVGREGTEDYPQKIPLIAKYRFGVATENYQGTSGYFSEKFFDVIRAGAVPIYLGDESVNDVIPTGAFVDARKFSSHAMLLRYLVNCPENEWLKMRAEGRTFLQSEQAAWFRPSLFAETAMEILRAL